jgi:hypothetical protein
MRLYFAADEQAEEKYQKRFSRIIEILDQAGVLVMSNLVDKNVSGFSSQDLEKFDAEGVVLLEKMDALIIEGTRPVGESGYLIALALAHQIPILYISEKTKPISQNLIHLRKDKKTAGLLNLQYYSEKTMEKTILDFLQTLETGEGRQIPNIKFTLRITPRIERFLHWRTANTKKTKADFLRELIEKLIDNDGEYQKFSSKK